MASVVPLTASERCCSQHRRERLWVDGCGSGRDPTARRQWRPWARCRASLPPAPGTPQALAAPGEDRASPAVRAPPRLVDTRTFPAGSALAAAQPLPDAHDVALGALLQAGLHHPGRVLPERHDAAEGRAGDTGQSPRQAGGGRGTSVQCVLSPSSPGLGPVADSGHQLLSTHTGALTGPSPAPPAPMLVVPTPQLLTCDTEGGGGSSLPGELSSGGSTWTRPRLPWPVHAHRA